MGHMDLLGWVGVVTKRAKRTARRHKLEAAAGAVRLEVLEPRQLLAGEPLIISEFLAVNDNGLRDRDNDRSDWIEIFNPGSTSVNLAGWRLTDDSQALSKWVFPSTTLNKGEYLVVFASNKNRAVAGQELHTNFKLSGDGEYLALVRPDGSIASEFAPAYPEQVEDVSFGISATVSDPVTLLASGSPAKALVPTDNSLALTWTQRTGFNDSGWISGPTGIGYDRDPTYDSLIGTDVEAQMYQKNATVYIRVPFTVADPGSISTLTLRLRYEDGFAAYLNGQKVASDNTRATLDWNSDAPNNRSDSLAVQYRDFDISGYTDQLVAGTNILAIHGLNRGTGSSDFLVLPEVVATTAVLGSTYQYSATPTPGEINSAGGLGVVEDTKFDHDRGFYDAPFDVKIETDTPGAEIRYTTDGSNPTATTGTVYSGPIHIDKTTILKAAAFKAGFISSDVDAQTYLFLDNVLAQTGAGYPDTWGYTGQTIRTPAGPDYAMDPAVVSAYSSTIRDAMKSLPTMSVVMDMNDLFGASGAGIYPAAGVPDKPASVEFFTADGKEQFQINGGISVVGEGIGGTSGDRWKTYKLSMKLVFKSMYGDPELDYPLYGPGNPDGFDQLILDGQINYSWLHPTDSNQRNYAKYISDQFVSNLQLATGSYGTHGRFVHLYLNGLYWGMYDLHERADEHFAADYFGGADEDYDVIKHGLRWGPEAVVNGSDTAFKDLFTRSQADLSITANYQRVEQVLDIDDFIDYMLANFYAGSDDWAYKNWYATYNRVDPNGRWRFHSWDSEHSLKDINRNSTTLDDAGGPTELHQNLKANAEYRLKFADHVREHFFNGGVMTPEATAALYQSLMDEVQAATIGESARWGDNRRTPAYTQADWINTQQGLLANYFPGRTNVVLGQLKAQGLYPSIEAPSFSKHGGVFASAQNITMTNPNGTGVLYYTTDGSDPRLPGGAVNAASARVYSGTLNVAASGRIKARVYVAASGTWSALNEAAFVIGPPPGLRVTEVMFNPAPPPPDSLTVADDYEFIELQNIGATPLNLKDFRISQDIEFTFPDMSVAPGQYVVFVKDSEAFQERYGSGIPIAGVYTGQLGNGGGRIMLQTHVGQTIQDFTFNGGWFGHVDGGGFSMTPIDPNATDAVLSTKAGWKPSFAIYGSPGAANPFVENPRSISINEALTHTDQPQGDWIELHNTTDHAININGWFLSDSDLNLAKYQITGMPEIPAGGYLVFTQRDHFGSAFGLSELGETIYLTSSDSAGNPGGYREDQSFDAAQKEVPFGLFTKSTGGTDFTAMSVPTGYPTPGPNAYPKVGPIVITEIMYARPDGTDEFIELYNMTDATVPLHDPLRPANTWKISDGLTFAFPAGASMAPRQIVLLVGSDPAAFRTRYSVPASVDIYRWSSGVLDNAGENLEISMPGDPELDGTVPYYHIDRVNYGIVAPWPTEAMEGGATLSRKALGLYGNDPANWATEPSGGTPGRLGLDFDPPTVQILDAVPSSAVESLTIVFNEPVTGFQWSDLVLSRNGGPNLLTDAHTLSSSDATTWIVNSLNDVTFIEGHYVFSLDPASSGITDMGGNALAAGASTSFDIPMTTVDGPSASNTYYLRQLGGDIQIFVNKFPGPKPTYKVPVGSITTLLIAGADGDDTVTLDLSGGNFIPSGGLTIDAGNQSGGDSLILIGDGTSALSYQPDSAAAGSGLVLVGGTAVNLSGVETISAESFGSFTLTTPNSQDAVTIDTPQEGFVQFAGVSGSVTFSPISVSQTPLLTLDAASNDAPGAGNDTVLITSLIISSGRSLQILMGEGQNTLQVDGGYLTLGGNLNVTASNLALDLSSGDAYLALAAGSGRLRLASLNLSPDSTLDLTNNDLVISATADTRNAVLTQVSDWIAAARNLFPDPWMGTGISTSAAAPLIGLNVALNDRGGAKLWSGEDINAVLVSYGYDGDVNLDGTINALDYFGIDSGYLAGAKDYANGDLNYDGVVNALDYFMIDSAFLGQSGPVSAAPLAATQATTPRTTANPAKPKRRSLFSAKRIAKSSKPPRKTRRRSMSS